MQGFFKVALFDGLIFIYQTDPTTFCHPDGHAQASEVLRPRHPFWPRWGSYTCPQCWHEWPAEGVETTSWSPSSDMATHHRERPQTSEPGTVVGPHRAFDCDLWHDIVEMAMLLQGHATWWQWLDRPCRLRQ